MRMVWDEAKRRRNLAKHFLDFNALSIEFFEAATIYPAKRGRFIAISEWNGVIAVVFARLGTEAISIISMRPASRKERMLS